TGAPANIPAGAIPFDRIMADRSTATIQAVRASSGSGPLMDNATTVITFDVDVAPGFTLSDLDVAVSLTHATLAQLQIRVISPTGVEASLINFDNLSGANLGILPSGQVPTIFDSQATRPITDMSVNAPYEGRL